MAGLHLQGCEARGNSAISECTMHAETSAVAKPDDVAGDPFESPDSILESLDRISLSTNNGAPIISLEALTAARAPFRRSTSSSSWNLPSAAPRRSSDSSNSDTADCAYSPDSPTLRAPANPTSPECPTPARLRPPNAQRTISPLVLENKRERSVHVPGNASERAPSAAWYAPSRGTLTSRSARLTIEDRHAWMAEREKKE